jgi:hypothetical protein
MWIQSIVGGTRLGIGTLFELGEQTCQLGMGLKIKRDGGRLFDYGPSTYKEITEMLIASPGYKVKRSVEELQPFSSSKGISLLAVRYADTQLVRDCCYSAFIAALALKAL